MLSLKRISFEVLAEPIPLARPRVVRGHAYLPKRSRDYREIVQQAAKIAMHNFAPMDGELFCRLSFYRKYKPTARNFGDVDNHVKAVLDALNGICYKDDAQVAHVTADKCLDKDEPRVAVDIGLVGFENVALPKPIDNAIVCKINLPRICPCEPAESSVTPALPAA